MRKWFRSALIKLSFIPSSSKLVVCTLIPCRKPFNPRSACFCELFLRGKVAEKGGKKGKTRRMCCSDLKFSLAHSSPIEGKNYTIGARLASERKVLLSALAKLVHMFGYWKEIPARQKFSPHRRRPKALLILRAKVCLGSGWQCLARIIKEKSPMLMRGENFFIIWKYVRQRRGETLIQRASADILCPGPSPRPIITSHERRSRINGARDFHVFWAKCPNMNLWMFSSRSQWMFGAPATS